MYNDTAEWTLLAWMGSCTLSIFILIVVTRLEQYTQYNTVHCTFKCMNSDERRELRYQRRKATRIEKKRKRLGQYDRLENVMSCNALVKAAKESRKTIRWKASVQRYFMNLLRSTFDLRDKLRRDENITMGFISFTICERGKIRHIRSVHFKERVVQRSLCDNVLVPMLGNSLIYDNGASLRGKGIHFALRRLKTHLSRYYRRNGFSNEGYILMIDFSAYFDNILHEPLYGLLDRTFNDSRVSKLCRTFIEPFGVKSVGIGSQVSQIFAVTYPNEIDHFIKQELGIEGYARYMDDSYLIHHDKAYLEYCLARLTEKYAALGIRVNPKKTQIIKLSHGFTFLKAKCYLKDNGKILMKPCRKSVTVMRRKLKKFRKMQDKGLMSNEDILCAYNSWRGYIQNFHSRRTVRNMDNLYHRLFGSVLINRKEKINGSLCID